VVRTRLLALGKALPQFGDGLEEALPERVAPVASGPGVAAAKGVETPVRVDLVSTRAWSGEQVWTPAVQVAVPGKRKRRR
jgi:hypothetical protein